MDALGIDLRNIGECTGAIDKLTDVLKPFLYSNLEMRTLDLSEYEPSDSSTRFSAGCLAVIRVKPYWTSYLDRIYNQLGPPWHTDPQLGKKVPEFSAYAMIGAFLDEDKKSMCLNVSAKPAIRYGVPVAPLELGFAKKELKALEGREEPEIEGLIKEAVQRLRKKPRFLMPNREDVRIYDKLRLAIGNYTPDRYDVGLIFARGGPEVIRRIVPRESLRVLELQIADKKRKIKELEEKIEKIDLLDGVRVNAKLGGFSLGIGYKPTPEEIKRGVEKSRRDRFYWKSVSLCDKEEVVKALGSLVTQLKLRNK
jgi:hypothetical protein